MSYRFWTTDPPKYNPDELGVWKFVKVNGEYRWIANSFEHRQCVEDGETAEAAGTVSLYPEDWKLFQSYSTTLKIGCHEAECDEVSEILGMEQLPGFGW
jgi:hypothetical protein